MMTTMPVYREYAHAQCMCGYRLSVSTAFHAGFQNRPVALSRGKKPFETIRRMPGNR